MIESSWDRLPVCLPRTRTWELPVSGRAVAAWLPFIDDAPGRVSISVGPAGWALLALALLFPAAGASTSPLSDRASSLK